MKSALVAIDPMSLKGSSFEHFCGMIRVFQKKDLFSRTSIASVIHPAQFLMPYSFYKEHKDELAKEARNKIKIACSDKFQFVNASVLQSNSHANEEVVEHLSKHGKRVHADLLVIGSNDRKGLPYWFLGSLSETASLTAKLPVLVIKGDVAPNELTRTINFTVGVDVAAPPSMPDLNWLIACAKASHAKINLLYVEPLLRPVIDRLQLRKSREEASRILERIQRAFEARGVPATASISVETRSIPHTIVNFAQKKGASLTVVTTPKRSKARKLLLGSTARHVLALSKRPFLSLRME